MNITDFAKSRLVQPQTVRHYLKEHPEINKYTQKNGRSVELLPEAIKLLGEKYPLPKPTAEILKGVSQEEYRELMQKLDAKNDYIIHLQEQLSELSKLHYLIEANTKEIARLEQENRQIEKQMQDIQTEKELLQQKLSDQTEEKQEALAEVERLKGRTLWERIRNK